jgi:nicotinate-nucleotide--dimethylbenzimidazole phosphoribosyltransferase
MRSYKVDSVSKALSKALITKINNKTKPLGALGRLEEIALQIGEIQQTLTPKLINPHILVFAGDHGIAHEGVSAYPQEVTWQMVKNFLSGGAAINVFCKQHNIELKVVDAGVNYDFPNETPGLIQNKIAKGTANVLREPAMSVKLAQSCIDTSANIIKEIAESGCTIIGFGEMGIANTSSAALLMSVLTKIPMRLCTGRGTGLDDKRLDLKTDLLKMALAKRGKPKTPIKTLATYGGFEIAQMVGAILQAAESKMIILIDGFIATTAYLVAQAIEPKVKGYCIFCHQSHEQGHKRLLEYLKVEPLLNLNMRLGEGTGVAVAYPIIKSAVSFLNQMASFDSASVSTKR